MIKNLRNAKARSLGKGKKYENYEHCKNKREINNCKIKIVMGK
jgi:hypothetical protein